MSRKKDSAKIKVNVEEIREQLLAQRDQLLQKAQQHHLEAQDHFKGDLVDQSTDLSERELMLELAESERGKLRSIEAALELMENDSYGVCESCSEPIPVKRLLAIPTARYCVPCQEKVERLEMSRV